MAHRFTGLGALSLQIAAKELESLTSKLFLSKAGHDQKNREIQEQIAELVFSKLQHLRGTGLKLLQVLSLDEDLLPVPLIKKFEAAYSQAPSLNRPIIKKVFYQEFNAPPESLFQDFNYEAFSAASIGQVHRARLHSGESVVVKVQYPNVRDHMATDLQLLQTLSQAIANPLIKNSIDELATHLLAETDYEQELNNTELFRPLAERGEISIPAVHREYSKKRILTLSQIEGVPLHQIDCQILRNQALQKIFDFFFFSLQEIQGIHADPHPGNILASPEGIALIDFGSVKKDLSGESIRLFLALLDSKASKTDLVDLYVQLGASPAKSEAQFYEDHIKEYHEIGSSLIGQSQLEISQQKAAVSQLRKILFFQSRSSELQQLSPEFTLLHRAFQALLLMLCKYQATIDSHIKSSTN